MHIIFGKNQALEEKYTVLELDTIQVGKQGPILTAYCVVENIPLEEMPAVETFKHLHSQLMDAYREKQWNTCDKIIAQLMGKWGGEVDTFYVELKSRIDSLRVKTLDESWNATINKF